MALKGLDRLEYLESQARAARIRIDLTFRWNTSVFFLASILGPATGRCGWCRN